MRPGELKVHLHSVRIQGSRLSADQIFQKVRRLEHIETVLPTFKGNFIRFQMASWFNWLGQSDFYVKVVKDDPAQRFFAARTMWGHPLSGWRPWEVDDMPNGDIVIRTFSVEHPHTEVDRLKLDIGGLAAMYKTWDLMLQGIHEETQGRIVRNSPDTLLRAGQRHEQTNIEPYYSRVR